MPFGLKNAEATYQRVATILFHDMMHWDIEVYVDDMIVKSRNRLDHLVALERFFERIKQFRLRLNPKKCTFGVTSRKLLKYMVSERDIEVDLDKIRAILDTLASRTEKEIRGFLGRLHHSLLLYLSVSDVALGCMLAQLDDSGKERAIYYLSKRMLDYETRYVLIERHCLALVWATQRFRHYMTEYSVHLISSLDPLRYLFDQSDFATYELGAQHAKMDSKLRNQLRSSNLALLFPSLSFSFSFLSSQPNSEDFSSRMRVISVHGDALVYLLRAFGRWFEVLGERYEPLQGAPIGHESPIHQLGPNHLTTDFDGRAINDDFPNEDVAVVTGLLGWCMYFDGVLLISPYGDHIPRYVRLAFSDRHPSTNSIVEYEACILGLKIALKLGIRQMNAFGDSNLVLRQIQGHWKTKDVKLRSYPAYLELLVGKFDDLRYTHLLRAQNQFVDALATIASMIDILTNTFVRILLIELRSVPAYCCLIDEAEFDNSLPWYHDIYQFLRPGAYLEATMAKDRRALR
ncbi:hypothetical protein AAG906_019650 [Vitis piasezkii]